MNKLEVGMYVRTKVGNIGKIIDYHGDVTDYFWGCYETDLTESLSKNYITEVDILKASYNITDLIEVGDYVNGEYVDLFSLEHYRKNPKNIKTIVTKEHFKSIEYRLGE
jgi:hypothetical protein